MANQFAGGAAFTPEQLAAAREWGAGKTRSEMAAKAQELGVTGDQWNSAFNVDSNWGAGDVWNPGAAKAGGSGTDATGQGYYVDSLGNRTNTYDNGIQPEPTPTASPSPAPTPSATPSAAPGSFNGGSAMPQNAIDVARSGTKGWTAQQIVAKGQELGMTPAQIAQTYGLTEDDVKVGGYGSAGGLMAQYRDVVWDGSKWVPKGASTSSTSTATSTAKSGGVGGTAPAAQPAVAGYTAAQTIVDPTKTTQGLMNSLLAEDSDYLKRARALSMDKFNERGLGSSSFAQGAGVAAAIDAALGIAAPDAQIYSGTARDNTNALNQAGQFNAGETNKFRLQEKAAAFDNERLAIQNTYDLNKMAVNQGYDMTKLDAGQSNDLQKMATAFGYDLTKMTAQEKTDLSKMAQAQTYLRDNMGLQNSFDISKMEKGAALALSQIDHQSLKTIEQMAAKFGFDMQLMSANQLNELAKIDKSGGYQLAAAGTSATTALTTAAMHIDATKALNIADQKFKTEYANNQYAMATLSDVQKAITAVQMNPNITSAEAKGAAVRDIVNIGKGSASVISMMAGDNEFKEIYDSIWK